MGTAAGQAVQIAASCVAAVPVHATQHSGAISTTVPMHEHIYMAAWAVAVIAARMHKAAVYAARNAAVCVHAMQYGLSAQWCP